MPKLKKQDWLFILGWTTFVVGLMVTPLIVP